MSVFESKVRSTLLFSAATVGAVLVAPNLAEASFGEKNLRFGMEDTDVKVLQERLKEKGFFDFHTATGYFGELTREAVIKFQKEHGLSQDGIVGPQTFSVLNGNSSSSGQSRQSSSENNSSQNSASSTYSSASSSSLSSINNTSQVMRNGTRNQDVSSLQAYLKKAGFYEHSQITGIYGNMTQQAVRNFQQARGLTSDGLAGPQTLSKVNKEIGGTAPSKSSSSRSDNSAKTVSNNSGSSSLSGVVLRQGARGAAVEELQKRLKDLGYYTSSIDGVYGPLTAASVRELQRQSNISVDGIFGPQTYRQLDNGNSSSSGSSSGSSGNSSQTSSGNSSSSTDLSGVVLRQGASGSQVRELQQRLKDLGYFTSSVDGSYGAGTAEAVRKLQRQTNISVDGIFGPQTFRQLEKNVEYRSSSNSSGSSSSSAPVLKEGSRGSNVSELQNMLKATGHYKSQVTGVFGPLTKEAVRKFQNQWGLIADGIATKATLEKLEEVAAVHMSESRSNSGSSQSFNTMNLIADASNYIGVPYVWGGTTASGFDCSGFIQHVFRNNGVNLPRTVAQQWDATRPVSKPQVGDIVYFTTYRAGPSHNGIYIGNNQFIHSGSSTGVTITSMDNSYWSPRYLGARRAK
ncbi:peptidoglycan-binding protein [Salipaludibacillus aurantiacus]|uniref:Putative peptidoglycan binding domain-containing protein n=1 Tax=Salipaludibacillus aurantiacus TaxID=1601833 RepID=A0A1H9VEJ3_9BACI|nr:peptidoglycan-binding protein [Salipaludibacillus aurantiacus]SES20186.1 Putative peptidoglycan binding domain-containing protein [Salipaludibacillus aurantiacus]